MSDERETTALVERDQLGVAGPGIDSNPRPFEGAALGHGPIENAVHQPASVPVRDASNPMQVHVSPALVLAPNRGIFVCDGKNTDDRLIVDHTKEPTGADLRKNRVVG